MNSSVGPSAPAVPLSTGTSAQSSFAQPSTERFAQVYLHTYGQPSHTPSGAPSNPTGKANTTPTAAPHQAARLTRASRANQLGATVLGYLAHIDQLVALLRTLPANARAIVSQRDWGQKRLVQVNQHSAPLFAAEAIPTTARLGLLGAIVFVLWWTWPTDPATLASMPMRPRTLAAPVANQVSDVNVVAAVVAPLIQPTANAPQAPNAGLNAILVPTATATKVDATATANTDGAVTTVVVPLRSVQTSGRSGLAGLLVPTSTPARIDAAVITVSVPSVEVIPGVEIRLPFGQPSPTPTITPEPTATPVPVNLSPGRLWSSFVPDANSDHYWVGRPFAPHIGGQIASPSYQFGSTAGDRYRTHHGVDISNPSGTPVLAATEGEVVHAGIDDPVLLGPYNNFYGNAVVIRLNRQLAVAGGQLDVYLLYGHLSQVTVSVGQQVRPEDVVGMVGMTGIAIGPHLHVEIRLGSNTYYNNVNPYLWLQPLEGQGSVAVRVLTADGRTWPGAYISVVRFSGGIAAWARQIVTYQDVENIGPDPAWGENGAMDGIPAGSYYVVGNVNGERLSAQVEVYPGRTTFVELRTSQ